MAELRSTMYRALRRTERFRLPQTAPIAATFEDCHQSFQRLSIVVTSISDDVSESNTVQEIFRRFLAWGYDSGASKRTLDRGLRNSSNLSRGTLDLLRSLYTTLNEGIPKEFAICYTLDS